jgi:CBS domain-containing protein
MNVRHLMTSPVRTCGPRDSLERAAQLLWEQDCGALPVVDEKGRVRALITDRDICMGAYTRGKRLSEIEVGDSMSKTVASCRPDDDVAVAAQRMAQHAVRRLPVVDGDGRIEGIVSLCDLARASERDKGAARAAGQALASVSRPRSAVDAPRVETALRPGAGPRAAAPASDALRGTVILASKTGNEC